MSAAAGPRGRRSKRVLLIAGIVTALIGLGLLGLWMDTSIQPGGPACFPQQPCQTSWWYWESTRETEVEIAFPILALSTGLLAVAATRPS